MGVLRAVVVVCAVVGCATVSPSVGERIGALDTLDQESAAIVDLGRSLFFDERLSRDRSLACVSCHRPELGFGDGLALARGMRGVTLRRHTPPLYNLGYNRVFFWDGRAASLESQAKQVIENPDEFDMSMAELVQRLAGIEGYRRAFAAAFPGIGVSEDSILRALGAFVASIVVDDTRVDRYLAGDTDALTPAEQRGMQLFGGKAHCIECHKGPNFTDQNFHHTGVSTEDVGRMGVVRNPHFTMRPYPFFANHKAFKTPGLRNVGRTAPYFHNGSAATLEEVVDFYIAGGVGEDRYGRSPEIFPLQLSEAERADLLAFLRALDQPVAVAAPAPMQ